MLKRTNRGTDVKLEAVSTTECAPSQDPLLSRLTGRILGQALLSRGEEGFFTPNYMVSGVTCPGADELGPL